MYVLNILYVLNSCCVYQMSLLMCAAFPLWNVIDELQFIQDVLGFSASASVILDHTGWPSVVFHFMQIIQDGLVVSMNWHRFQIKS
jgi:hypothetical protein